MAINTNVARITVLDPDNRPARFTISLFGLPTKQITAIHTTEALLEQRNYNTNYSLQEAGYRAESLREVHPHSLAPPRFAPIKRPTKRSSLANEFS